MEYIFKADSNHRFYEKCLETYNEEKLAFEKAVELCAEYGIERYCVGMNSDNLFLNADCNYSDEVKQMLKVNTITTNNKTYYTVKKNSILGKKFKLYSEGLFVNAFICLDLFNVYGDFSHIVFIYDEKLYAYIDTEHTIEKPEGFEFINPSDYHTMLEYIKENKLTIKRINVY